MSKLDDLVVIRVNRKLNNDNFNALVSYCQRGLESGFILLDEDCELVNPKVKEVHQPEPPNWISIKDMVPPINKRILVFDKNHQEIKETVYHLGYEKDFLIQHYGVTHWMPLPEPPEE